MEAASLVYRVGSRTAIVIQRSPVSKRKKEKKKERKRKKEKEIWRKVGESWREGLEKRSPNR